METKHRSENFQLFNRKLTISLTREFQDFVKDYLEEYEMNFSQLLRLSLRSVDFRRLNKNIANHFKDGFTRTTITVGYHDLVALRRIETVTKLSNSEIARAAILVYIVERNKLYENAEVENEI